MVSSSRARPQTWNLPNARTCVITFNPHCNLGRCVPGVSSIWETGKWAQRSQMARPKSRRRRGRGEPKSVGFKTHVLTTRLVVLYWGLICPQGTLSNEWGALTSSGWGPGTLLNTPRSDLAPMSAEPGLRNPALAHAATSRKRTKTAPWGNAEM